MWSIFSMLKATLKVKNSVDISTYHKLIAFVKQRSKGYKAKKSGIFEKSHFIKFILEPPDSKFLMIKVAFIIGISGACRREKLMKMTINDVEIKETVLIIRIPDSKNDYGHLYPTIINTLRYLNPLSSVRRGSKSIIISPARRLTLIFGNFQVLNYTYYC